MKRRTSFLAAAAFLFAGFFYANAWPTHLGYRPIVDDIIAKADARIASGQTGANLRFGHDYTFLPLLMTLDVNAFKRQSYRPVMREVCTVDTAVPEVSGLCLAPDGKSLLAASDENGVYHVSFSGETEPFYVESRGLDCEGVTSDPETGDVYYIVERRQELRRLRAPEYQESELLTVIPEGLRTNSGLEAVTWLGDGTLLLGNQEKPRLLIRYSLTDGVVGRTEITEGIRDISDLCYDPVRDALWIADSELRTINLCTMEGKVLVSYPVPFIDNGEGLYVDHENSCIWVGDDTTNKLYKISFSGL